MYNEERPPACRINTTIIIAAKEAVAVSYSTVTLN
jgi:hypothetical protein